MKAKKTENDKLVKILYELKRINDDSITVTGTSLARRIYTLQDVLIAILEEITGHTEDPPVPPMTEEEKTHRRNAFLKNIQEAREIEKNNFEYDQARDSFGKIICDFAVEDYNYIEEKSEGEGIPIPDKKTRSIDFVEIEFPCEPSASICEALTSKGFTVRENLAYGNGGQWLSDMVDAIILERGEIKLPRNKGTFDPWL